MAPPRKKLLLICRHAPYGNTLARAALDVALAGAAFDQDLSLLFLDDGVWQLVPGQTAAEIGSKSLRATLDSLPLYDLEQFHVCTDSLASRGLEADELPGQLVLVNRDELGAFIASHDQLLSF